MPIVAGVQLSTRLGCSVYDVVELTVAAGEFAYVTSMKGHGSFIGETLESLSGAFRVTCQHNYLGA
jgi:hypothetical protein